MIIEIMEIDTTDNNKIKPCYINTNRIIKIYAYKNVQLKDLVTVIIQDYNMATETLEPLKNVLAKIPEFETVNIKLDLENIANLVEPKINEII